MTVTEQEMDARIARIQELKRQKIAAGDVNAMLSRQEIDQVVPEKFLAPESAKWTNEKTWTPAVSPPPAEVDLSVLSASERTFWRAADAMSRAGQDPTPRAVDAKLGLGLKNPSSVVSAIRKKGLWPWPPARKGPSPGARKKDRPHAVRTTPGPDSAGLVPPPAPRADAVPLTNGHASDHQPGPGSEEPRSEDRQRPGRDPQRQPEAPASRFSLTDFVATSNELDLEQTVNLAVAIRECRPGLRSLLLAFAGELLLEDPFHA